MKSLLYSEDVTSLRNRLHQVKPGSQRRWGKMTSHQMICHLSDSFLVGLGERKVSFTRGFLNRTLIKWMALYVPFPWPRGVPTRPEIDQHAGGGTRPADFNRDLQQLEDVLDRFARLESSLAEHPIFGPLSAAEWKRWGYLHVDHHLRQFGE